MTVKLFSSIALFISTQFVSCLRHDDNFPKPQPEKDKKEIAQIIEVFRTTLKSKDVALHKSLYVSGSIPINFNFKNQGYPYIYSMNANSWSDFYPTFPDYYAVYATPSITVQNGTAISNHHFESYKSGALDHTGNDMLMYIKTPQGFKIISLNSTLVDGTDSSDYSSLSIAGSPKDAFTKLTSALNARDYTAYAEAFFNEAVPCFGFKKQMTDAYSDTEHSSKPFFSIFPNGAQIRISNLNTTIHDQITASATAEFFVSKDGKALQQGTLMATLIATKDIPWKISTLVFSLK